MAMRLTACRDAAASISRGSGSEVVKGAASPLPNWPPKTAFAATAPQPITNRRREGTINVLRASCRVLETSEHNQRNSALSLTLPLFVRFADFGILQGEAWGGDGWDEASGTAEGAHSAAHTAPRVRGGFYGQ
jgi:hypothetical protein